MPKLKILVTIILIFFPFNAYSLTESQIQSVTNGVLEICRAGKLEGHTYALEGEGTAGINVLRIKNMFGAGIDGKISLTENEWKGIKPYTSADSSAQSEYNKCVMVTLPILANIDSKVKPVKPTKE